MSKAHIVVHERRAGGRAWVGRELLLRAREKPRDWSPGCRTLLVRVEEADRLPGHGWVAFGGEDDVERHGARGEVAEKCAVPSYAAAARARHVGPPPAGGERLVWPAKDTRESAGMDANHLRRPRARMQRDARFSATRQKFEDDKRKAKQALAAAIAKQNCVDEDDMIAKLSGDRVSLVCAALADYGGYSSCAAAQRDGLCGLAANDFRLRLDLSLANINCDIIAPGDAYRYCPRTCKQCGRTGCLTTMLSSRA